MLIACPGCAVQYAFSTERLGERSVDVRCPICRATFSLDRSGVRRPGMGVLRRRRRARPAAPRPLARLTLIAAQPGAGEGVLVEVRPRIRTEASAPTRARSIVRLPRSGARAPLAGVTALPVAHGRRRWSAAEVDVHPPTGDAPSSKPPLRRWPLAVAACLLAGLFITLSWPQVQQTDVAMTMASQPPPPIQIASLVEPLPARPRIDAGQVVRRDAHAIAFGLVTNETGALHAAPRIEAVLLVDGRPHKRRVVHCCDGFALDAAERIIATPDHDHFRYGRIGPVDPLAVDAEAPITVIFTDAPPTGALTVRMRLLPSK